MRQQLVTPRIEVMLVHLGCYLVIVVVYSYHNWAELLITFLSRKLLWLLLALCELVFRKGASRSVQLNCSVQCVWCVFSNRFSLSISGDRSILSLLFKAMRKKKFWKSGYGTRRLSHNLGRKGKPVAPALRRLRQKDTKIKASLCHTEIFLRQKWRQRE